MVSTAEQTAPSRRWLRPALLGLALAAVAAAGLVGAYRYLDNYWLYRGFPPPSDPAFVKQAGKVVRFYVTSAALGGRRQPVDVYLPPGYVANPRERYPVFYLLHGFPGRPGAFFQTVRLGVVEDVLLARHAARPMILAAPFGSTGTFTDKEWTNGIDAHEGWETFVARDLVRAIDAHYRTVRSGSARILGGLSEGGYGAINIGLHHPGEFKVLESWSGYERAADIGSIFGHRPALLRQNSPLDELPRAAPALRAAHTYVWFYSGLADHFLGQNRSFSAALARDRVTHRFRVLRGGHDWALWRGNAALALLAASNHLGSWNA
jgi:enterochelin esterase-like enzyme